ncbi:protein PFC0760c-like isoform X2 [Bradysia coprophila]|uniref:protein PFC0760c-like isoform X2 n=1 Tax=Bradysia coprophila TaxID=38358 RepID=UPI00187DD9DB|nr:protein PFC0760c-like isoform X2 [Bradysia coprophila]
MQNDMIIDHHVRSKGLQMSGKRSWKEMSKRQQSDEEMCHNDSVERVNGRLDSSIAKRRRKFIEQPSLTNVELEQLRLECSLLKVINKSLKDDNESLRMVNRILGNNYDMLKERLELVQSEHRSQLTHLEYTSQILESSSTNKHDRSNQHDDSSESSATYNKRRRFEGNGRGTDLQIVLRTGSTSSEGEFSSDVSTANDKCTSETEEFDHSDAVDNDVNGTEDVDHFNANGSDMSGDSEDDDVELIATDSEPICIDLSDSSNENDDCEDDKGNEDGTSENLDNDSFGNESLSDDDPLNAVS